MPHLFKRTASGLRRLGTFLYILKFRIKKKLGWLGIPIIQTYLGYGNTSRFYVYGRVLEEYALSKPLDKRSIWDNMKAMYKRYMCDFFPEVSIKAHFNGQEITAQSNEEGYFDIEFVLPEPLPAKEDWFEVELELMDKVLPRQGRVTATAEVMVSELNSEFGIISDVDDTILISRATHFIKKIRLLLLKNAHTRLPFQGVSAFYKSLQKGSTSTFFNPIFYVSSSSWKLYDLLLDFCKIRGIPKGPFMLRASRIDDYKFLSSIHNNHKLQKIEHILSTYDNLKFILIGDSGQKDPEIYEQVAKDFPGRIKVIYIRDVSKNKRDQQIERLSNHLEENGIEMVYVSSTTEAAQHALNNGFIHADNIGSVLGEAEKDELYSDDPDELIKEEEEEKEVSESGK